MAVEQVQYTIPSLVLVGRVLPSVAATNDACIFTGESRGWGRGFVGGTLGTVCLTSMNRISQAVLMGCLETQTKTRH